MSVTVLLQKRFICAEKHGQQPE